MFLRVFLSTVALFPPGPPKFPAVYIGTRACARSILQPISAQMGAGGRCGAGLKIPSVFLSQGDLLFFAAGAGSYQKSKLLGKTGSSD